MFSCKLKTKAMKTTDNKHKIKNDINSNLTNQNDESHIPKDLIDDLNKNKIDILTDGATNLGYEERAPRKKELEQKEHLDSDDK